MSKKSFQAIAQLTRKSGNTFLFGTPVQQQNYISLKIQECDVSREHSEDRYSGRKTIVEVNLSIAQFAELITGVGTEGVPCTLTKLQGSEVEIMPTPEEESRKFAQDLTVIDQEIHKSIESLEDAITALKIPHKTKMELRFRLKKVQQGLDDQKPFVEEMFEQRMHEVVQDAKIQINQHQENLLRYVAHAQTTDRYLNSDLVGEVWNF